VAPQMPTSKTATHLLREKKFFYNYLHLYPVVPQSFLINIQPQQQSPYKMDVQWQIKVAGIQVQIVVAPIA
jgi:hypothetical protein